MSRRLFLVLVSALVLAGAGCGVPTDGGPRALPDDAVPSDLLALDPITTTTTVPVGFSTSVRIYLVGGPIGSERLVSVERAVQTPATVERILDQLTLGPTPDETERGLRSALLPGTTVNSVLVESGIAVVDLAEKALAVIGTDYILALAQLVYTATELQSVGAVRFTVDGRRASVPTGTGEETPTAVGRATYAAYGPR